MSDMIICRLCLLNGEATYYNVFETKSTEKIWKLLEIEIREDDPHPKNICIDCLKRLNDFSTFAEQCRSCQDVFVLHCSMANSKNNQNLLIEDPNLVQIFPQEPHFEISFVTATPPTEQQLPSVLPQVEEPMPEMIKIPEIEPEDEEIHVSEDESEVELNYDDPEKILNASPMKGKLIKRPKVLIRDAKLTVRGKELNKLMSDFYTLECDVCSKEGKRSKTYKDIYNLFNHYKSRHGIKGYVVCCGQRLFKARALALHMCRHLEPESFRCPDCNKMLTCPKILQYHRQNHLPEDQRPLACKQCPRRFSYNSALIAHSISHLPEDQRNSYSCSECGKSYCSAGRLSSHLNLAHSKTGEEFSCHLCQKRFTSKGNLSYHLTTHQPNLHSMQCKICEKWLKNKVCLRKHMIQHSAERLKCHLCSDYETVNKQCLANHIRIKHNDEKNFLCEICNKSFKLKNTLKNHLRQHTKETPYSCEFCKRKFTSSGNFYAHRKRMHAAQVQQLKEQKEREAATQRQLAKAC
ncbi:zinc finger protein 879-like [Culicoides brevitarsis]|uniref:zinc finger protein 879-like n=1 Tax=Culicoides brevitarsis TaxID=469753 RepID=UPI00307BA68F